MTRKEAMRQNAQADTLRSLGFTAEEAEELRRISMALRRWHEAECGTDHGCIEYDDDQQDGKAYWLSSVTGRRLPIPNRGAGARRRLAQIIQARNERVAVAASLDRVLDRRGAVRAYIQTDPRGAALYIIRPDDVPAGQPVDAYYSRGICVY